MENNGKDLDPEKFSDVFDHLRDPALKSSIRLLILISLGMNTRLNFSDLLKLTRVGKGSLHNHIMKLESSGFVSTTKYSFFSSQRLRVELTPKGEDFIKMYLKSLRSTPER